MPHLSSSARMIPLCKTVSKPDQPSISSDVTLTAHILCLLVLQELRPATMLNRLHCVQGRTLIFATALASACATAPIVPSSALVGRWRQAETDCGVAIDVRELEFRADGWFSVTWRPFETYRDYSGRWSFNQGTRELELVIEGGNNRPTDFMGHGRITLSGGSLHLGEISLGSAYGRAPCTASFQPIPSR